MGARKGRRQEAGLIKSEGGDGCQCEDLSPVKGQGEEVWFRESLGSGAGASWGCEGRGRP